jgi:hypothetical protein
VFFRKSILATLSVLVCVSTIWAQGQPTLAFVPAKTSPLVAPELVPGPILPAVSDGPRGTLENIHPSPVGPSASEIHRLRVRKCLRIIQTFYDYAGRANFTPHIEYFVSYHERLEREGVARGDMRAKGFGECWWWSLVYGGANFGMTCYGVSPGNCAGPLDVKAYPLVLDPEENIRHHTDEMFSYYRDNGVRGIDLCEWVMYPSAPFDWGGGMFHMTNEKHLADIVRAYKFKHL